MENIQLNGSGGCRKYYKCILTTAVLVALAASTAYLLFQNKRQKEIVQDHVRAINELQSVINNKHLMINFNDYMNSVFNDRWFSFRKFFSNMENQILELHHNFNEKNRNDAVDTVSNEKEYIVTAALPGFSKDEITIKLSGSNLEIAARHVSQDNSDNESNKDTLDKQAKKHIRYRVTVPANIDQNNITAQLNNGLLTIKFSRIIDQTPVEPKEILID
jgi:HSP20 family protein